MIVYEVNLRVAPSVLPAYRAWLTAHIDELLRLDGFVAATVFADETDDSEGDLAGLDDADRWPRLVVHYTLTDRAALDRYFATDAPRMRADGVARFGDRFMATRRILALDTVQGRDPFGWSKKTR